LKIPYLGEWWRGRDPFQLWTIGEIMKLSPILIMSWGYSIFSQIYGWSVKDSLVIPGLVSIIAEGLYLSWDYGNKSAAARTLPMNMQIKWSSTNIKSYIVTITDYKVLKENSEKNEERDENKERDKENDYQYELLIEDPITDPINKEKFKHLLMFCKYPFETTFRRIPGQPIIYGGSVFYGPTAVISTLWIGDTENIGNIDEGKLEEFRIFEVLLCPEDGNETHEELGISPSINKNMIRDIVDLSDSHKAVKLQMSLNEEQSLVETLVNRIKTVEEMGVGLSGMILENDRFIRQPRFRINLKGRRTRIVLIILGLGILYGAWYIARARGWI